MIWLDWNFRKCSVEGESEEIGWRQKVTAMVMNQGDAGEKGTPALYLRLRSHQRT